jgi:hypothetical protein
MLAAAISVLCRDYYQRKSEPIIGWFARINRSKVHSRPPFAHFPELLRQLATSLKVLRSWREIFLVCFWTVLLWFAISIRPG